MPRSVESTNASGTQPDILCTTHAPALTTITPAAVIRAPAGYTSTADMNALARTVAIPVRNIARPMTPRRPKSFEPCHQKPTRPTVRQTSTAK
jgi:hypothetical protein